MASTQAIRMVAVYALVASVAVCCFPMLALGAHPTVATIHNNVPRVDTAGNIVNAHDGSIIRHNGTFYMYGTVYELCHQPGPQCHVPCGYNPNRYALYTSPDLMAWTLANDNILPDVAKNNDNVDYWMPVVAYNNATRLFVMQYWSSTCGFTAQCANVATSASPLGPFKPQPPIQLHGGVPSSQMGMFVDYRDVDPVSGAPRAYVKYNTDRPTKRHVVEALSTDWLSSTGEWAVVFPKVTYPWNEGGGMFRRAAGGVDLYYYMTGSDCCFCQWGGDARIWTAASALGPWYPGVLRPGYSSQRTCDLTGTWECSSGANESATPCPFPSLTVEQDGGAGRTFRVVAPNGTTMGGGTVAQNGYVNVTWGNVGTLVPLGLPGAVSDASGLAVGCDMVRWYGHEGAHWCRSNTTCTVAAPPQLNVCSNGKLPVEEQAWASVAKRQNPCSPALVDGTNFTVPAQQFNVVEVWPGGRDHAGAEAAGAGANASATVDPPAEPTLLYYGERSRSAPDGLKGHNYQAWVPVRFQSDGSVSPMQFLQAFQVPL